MNKEKVDEIVEKYGEFLNQLPLCKLYAINFEQTNYWLEDICVANDYSHVTIKARKGDFQIFTDVDKLEMFFKSLT